MTWYGVLLVWIISVCSTANIKAQEPVIAPGNCAGTESEYIGFYQCMFQCFQDDFGCDIVETDVCSEDAQAELFQGDGADAYTVDDLTNALQCVTGRCQSVATPSDCQDSDDEQETFSKFLKTCGVQAEQSNGGQDASRLLLKFLKVSGIQPEQLYAKLLDGSEPEQSGAVSGPQSGIVGSGFGPDSESEAFASASGDNIDECDQNSEGSVSSNNPTRESSSILISLVTSESSMSGVTPVSFLTATTSDSSTSDNSQTTTASGVSDSSLAKSRASSEIANTLSTDFTLDVSEDDCEENGSSANGDTAESSAGSSDLSDTVNTLSTDSVSNVSDEDCEEFNGSQSNFDENSNGFSGNENNFQSAEAVASANGDTAESSSNDNGYFIDNCYYYYDDFNGTFSNCSFYNESSSDSSYYNSSESYDFDNSTDCSNYDSSSAFSEVQTTNQNSGMQPFQSNNEGASSISIDNGQNQEDFANAAVSNQNPTTGQNLGNGPSGSSQDQVLFAKNPAQNQGPTIQQFQNNNNGLRDLNSPTLGQYGNGPVAGQLIKDQFQSTFANIPGFQITGSQVPAVQQYQSINNGGGVAIGSGQNPGQFANPFSQSQGLFQSPADRQYGNSFSTNQQYPAGNGGSGNTQGLSPNFPAQTQTFGSNNFGSLPQFNSPNNGVMQPNSAIINGASSGLSLTQGGFYPNVPARNNFGTGLVSNFQQNNDIVPPYNGGGNNLGVVSSVPGSGISNQMQSLPVNVPIQGSAFPGSGNGAGPNFNTFQFNGNAPQINGGGIGQNANGGAINSYASSYASAGFNTAGVSTYNQPNGGSVPFSQGSASAFGSSANAQAQASVG